MLSSALRGGADFDSLEAYRDRIADLIGRRNARRDKLVGNERAQSRPLPPRRSTDHNEATVVVTSNSGFTLRRVFYTGPSFLIGYRLKVRIYDDRLECFLAQRHVLTLPRGRPPAAPDPSAGATPSPSCSACRPNMLPGTTTCPTASVTVLPLTRCRTSLNWTSKPSPNSPRHAAADEIEPQ